MELTINDIAGYADSRMAWKCLRDVSAQLLSSSCRLPRPERVTIKGDTFTIDSNAQTAEADDNAAVRELGATIFYMLMGTKIVDRERQTASTNLPVLNPGNCGKALSDLVRQMLSFRQEDRPSLHDINDSANREYDRICALSRQREDEALETGVDAPYESFWPEAMRRVGLMLLVLFVATTTFAQKVIRTTEELDKLIRCVVDMRQTAKRAQVEKQLSAYTFWTLMDEVPVDKRGECKVYDQVATLNMNGIGRKIFKKRSGVPLNAGDRFCNGADPHFNYSFLEVTARKGATVTYPITLREGEQTFAIIPYSDKIAYEADLSFQDKKQIHHDEQHHVRLLKTESPVVPTDTLVLRITNKSNDNASFVIVNYNSRSK